MSAEKIRKRLEEMERLEKEATPGPWLEREDYDYYQGGTYLGIGPYHYGGNPNGKIPGPGPDGKIDYFDRNVCRIESNDPDKAFIAASRNALPALLAALREAVGALDIYARYMDGDNPQFMKSGWQKYPSPQQAKDALDRAAELLEGK